MCVTRLKWLRNYKYYVSLQKGTMQSEFDQQIFKHMKKNNVENIELCFAFSGEW